MQTCHHLISSILITTVLLIGCTQSKMLNSPQTEMLLVVVSTITVLPQSMNVIENLPGRVTAYRIAEIRPQEVELLIKCFLSKALMCKQVNHFLN